MIHRVVFSGYFMIYQRFHSEENIKMEFKAKYFSLAPKPKLLLWLKSVLWTTCKWLRMQPDICMKCLLNCMPVNMQVFSVVLMPPFSACVLFSSRGQQQYARWVWKIPLHLFSPFAKTHKKRYGLCHKSSSEKLNWSILTKWMLRIKKNRLFH